MMHLIYIYAIFAAWTLGICTTDLIEYRRNTNYVLQTVVIVMFWPARILYAAIQTFFPEKK